MGSRRARVIVLVYYSSRDLSARHRCRLVLRLRVASTQFVSTLWGLGRRATSPRRPSGKLGSTVAWGRRSEAIYESICRYGDALDTGLFSRVLKHGATPMSMLSPNTDSVDLRGRRRARLGLAIERSYALHDTGHGLRCPNTAHDVALLLGAPVAILRLLPRFFRS